jgi:hypothetical protein
MKKKAPRKPIKAEAAAKPPAKRTKFGFIFECCADGADHKVFEQLLGKLRPDIEPVYRFARSKRLLFDQCSAQVAGLFEVERCQRVFVVWDLIPCDEVFKHGGKPSCVLERAHLWAELPKQHRDRTKTVMLCITHELEAWLLADGAALTSFQRPEHPIRPIGDEKKPESIPNPKAFLKQVFKKNGFGEYDDLVHASKIIARVGNLQKLDHARSFKRFRERLMAP